MSEITEKQLQQVSENLKMKPTPVPLPSALPSMGQPKSDIEAPPCKCGKPRKAVWLAFLGRYIHVNRCADCEAKQAIIDILCCNDALYGIWSGDYRN